MKFKIFVLTIFVLLTCLSVAPAQTKKETAGIQTVDFKNFNYGADCSKMVPLQDDNLVLKNGHQGNDLAYAKLFSVKYVDFDGDGKDEAFVVVDGQSGGSSGVYLGAYVFAYRNGSAKKIWSQCFERSDAKLEAKTIVFRRPNWLKNDPHCCFSQIVTQTFAWKRSKIALISTKTTKSDNK